MIETPSASAVAGALRQRLAVVAEVLIPDPELPTAGLGSGDLLNSLVGFVKGHPSHNRIWLLYAAVTGAMPTQEAMQDCIQFIRQSATTDAILWLLDQAYELAAHHDATVSMEIIRDRVIVDVDHCARHDLHTGIQQVVRRTLPLWSRDYPIEATVWIDRHKGFRALSDIESRRVMQWGSDRSEQVVEQVKSTLLVPWDTVVVLAETTHRDGCDRLAALARYSGNRVVAIGYDCIPAVSADLVASEEPKRFSRYLTVIKHSHRVAGISESATIEFQGYSDALAAQGLPGPTVSECVLPARSLSPDGLEPPGRAPISRVDSSPTVLCVGTFEPRKNQRSLLYASERLWREGLSFELVFVTGSAWDTETVEAISLLRSRGRPIETRIGISDRELVAAYREARFTVFPSLHEGYGLPVVESLSLGTPVITAEYGSTREVGAGGGALLIDPRDDEALVSAMRELLTDDDAIERLRVQLKGRSDRTWEDYARELWTELVAPELDFLRMNRHS